MPHDDPSPWHGASAAARLGDEMSADAHQPGDARGFVARTRAGAVMIGSFVMELPERATVECFAAAGFDFVILDLEHSSTSLERLGFLIAVARAAQLGAVVRVEPARPGLLTRVLDMQPDGVMVPGVTSPAAAAAIVDASRFHPSGHRGLAPIVRRELPAPVEASQTPLLLVQIEGLRGVDAAGEIAAVSGIDAVFVGPYDLSQALGVPGDLAHVDVRRAGREIATRIGRHAVLGTYVETDEQAAFWRELGATFFARGTDGQLLLASCRAARSALERALPGVGEPSLPAPTAGSVSQEMGTLAPYPDVIGIERRDQ